MILPRGGVLLVLPFVLATVTISALTAVLTAVLCDRREAQLRISFRGHLPGRPTGTWGTSGMKKWELVRVRA